MKQTIYINGITCDSCIEKIQNIFKEKYDITDIQMDKETGKIEYEHDIFLANSQISEMFAWTKYSLADSQAQYIWSEEKITLKAYIPLFTLFWYITVLSLWVELIAWDFSIMRFMQHFMAGFFLSFSYFKLINLKEFSMSYSMYDVVAMKWKNWWYVYAFIELALGILYFMWFALLLTNIVTFIVMSVSIVWVIQSVMKKQKIKCACLWAVFNLPMSTITIIEDALMIVMSWAMIFFIAL